MKIEIICPIYNGEKYIIELNKSIRNQKDVEIDRISYVLTESEDKSEELLKSINASYSIVKKENFSHSLTREQVAMKSLADILVFITMDIEIKSDDWLKKLVKPIVDGEAEASFSRQITKFDNIEKYTREKNYPNESYIVDKDSLNTMGMRAFFFSDASSSIKTEVFKKLNGYDKKDFPTNEDQYIAYKMIINGYKIKYCADSVVYHSHNFTLKQIYRRYYDTGKFYKMENYLDNYGTNKTGGNLARYVLKRAFEDRNYKVLLRFIPDMAMRYIGMKVGKMNG